MDFQSSIFNYRVSKTQINEEEANDSQG